MAKTFYRPVVKILTKNGFKRIGNFKGSHERWFNAESEILVAVPYNLKKRHTANNVMKGAKINHKF